jgi:hypothetical protein
LVSPLELNETVRHFDCIVWSSRSAYGRNYLNCFVSQGGSKDAVATWVDEGRSATGGVGHKQMTGASMRTEVNRTAKFGDFVAAAFDGAAHYSDDPLVVSRLAAGAVSLLLRHTRSQALLLLQPTTGTKAASPVQLA